MNPEPNHNYQKAFSNCWENGPSVLWKSRPQAQPNAWGYESWFSERALGIVKDPTVIVSTQSWLRCHASISRDLEGHDIYRRSGCKYGQVNRPLSGPLRIHANKEEKGDLSSKCYDHTLTHFAGHWN